jgi:hypothetical protein
MSDGPLLLLIFGGLALQVSIIVTFFSMNAKLGRIEVRLGHVGQAEYFLACKAGASLAPWHCVECGRHHNEVTLVCPCGHVKGEPKKQVPIGEQD